MAKADLHIHTTASDGLMTPKEVVKEAANLNLSIISVTDHDTIDGLTEAKKESLNHHVELIPGVELTTSFGEEECHLLAYDFDVEDDDFNQLLHAHQKARVHRAQWIIEQLRNKGLKLDIEEVLAETNGKNVGRPHIAKILRKKGYIHSIKEAFIRYLSNDALGTIKNNYIEYVEVIDRVKQAGGVAVLAHPGRLYDETQLTQFVEAGIDGIEIIHPGHNYEIQKSMEDFAGKHNLLMTGGSDFHSHSKSYYRHFGLLTIPINQVEKIKALAKRRKQVTV